MDWDPRLGRASTDALRKAARLRQLAHQGGASRRRASSRRREAFDAYRRHHRLRCQQAAAGPDAARRGRARPARRRGVDGASSPSAAGHVKRAQLRVCVPLGSLTAQRLLRRAAERRRVVEEGE